MDLMSLVATLTLDSGSYTQGIADAKKAAEDMAESVEKSFERAQKAAGGDPEGKKKKQKQKEQKEEAQEEIKEAQEASKLNLDGVKTFIEYIVEHKEALDSGTGTLKTMAKAFGEASQGSANEFVKGLGTFVSTVAENSGNLDTTAGKLETFAKAFVAATEGSENTFVKSAHTFLGYMVEHKTDLNTTSGKLKTLAGALGETLQISDDPMAKGAGKFLSYVAENSDKFNSVAGVIETLAGGLGEALKGSDNEGVALAGDFLSYMAQNASNLTNPVGIIMTLLVYLVQNWDTISSFFSSIAPQWLLDLPGDLAEFWQTLIDKITTFVDWINTAIERLQAFFSVDDNTPEFNENDQYDDAGRLNSPGGLPDEFPHAAGLNYVPNNGYRAILHEGEAVLNKSDASAWRAGGVPFDYDRFASIIANALLGLGVSMDGQTVGRITAETVSREIAKRSSVGGVSYVY